MESTAVEVMERVMTEDEARECINEIKSGMNDMREKIYDLYVREGWKSLKYESWRACVTAEFGGKENYMYKLLAAAKVETNICTKVQIGAIPETHLRPLAGLEPDEQRAVWQQAVETAPGGKITAMHVENIVAKREEEDGKRNFKPISIAMKCAVMAISQLERINPNDPDRDKALEKVKSWISKNRTTGGQK